MLRDSFSFNKLCKQNNYNLVQGDGAPTEFQNVAVDLFCEIENVSNVKE